MTVKKLIREVDAFYPEYLKAHSNMGNQILHFIGASLFFALVVLAFVLGNYWLIGAAVVAGYLLPGIGHRFFEHNDSFRTSNPVLCVFCALRLYIDTLTFRIHKKLKLTVDKK